MSIDYRTDPRSCIVDALSTMVINDTQVKLYLWYDNEWGYVNRAAELANYICFASSSHAAEFELSIESHDQSATQM